MSISHYFVDEAGTPTLFSEKGKVIVGTEGCSQFFMLGKLDIEDPLALAADLEALRIRILSDPWFAKIPSIQLGERKTAIAFHAKDDAPEVRYEVFRLMLKHSLKFYAIVRDKNCVVAEVQKRNAADPNDRYNENRRYDDLVSRLFKDRWLTDDDFKITYAKRGNRLRTEAFRLAIEKAGEDFERDYGIARKASFEVVCSTPEQTAGLQAVDYFLWALQRLYEKGEDRYWEFVWSKVNIVIGLDADKSSPLYFTQVQPLNKATRAK